MEITWTNYSNEIPLGMEYRIIVTCIPSPTPILKTGITLSNAFKSGYQRSCNWKWEPYKMEGTKQTSAQCGNCKWWDKQTEWIERRNNKLTNHCKAPLPDSISRSYRDTVMVHEGQSCPVYEERKE